MWFFHVLFVPPLWKIKVENTGHSFTTLLKRSQNGCYIIKIAADYSYDLQIFLYSFTVYMHEVRIQKLLPEVC